MIMWGIRMNAISLRQVLTKWDWAQHGGLLALVLILIFNSLVTPNFLQTQALAVNIS